MPAHRNLSNNRYVHKIYFTIMARVVNKVKKNAQKMKRARRHALKSTRQATPSCQVEQLNESVDSTIRPARMGESCLSIKASLIS